MIQRPRPTSINTVIVTLIGAFIAGCFNSDGLLYAECEDAKSCEPAGSEPPHSIVRRGCFIFAGDDLGYCAPYCENDEDCARTAKEWSTACRTFKTKSGPVQICTLDCHEDMDCPGDMRCRNRADNDGETRQICGPQ